MQTNQFDGALLCARYSFAPNFYHYCGPDTNGEFGEYIKHEAADLRLMEHISRFETLYGYLQAIAHANGIADPLDPRVVEAYWVGNRLLEKLTEKDAFATLTEYLHLYKKNPKKEVDSMVHKIDKGARMHHSFHVFNVFTRTGHKGVAHTVDTMDQCRIGWGKIIEQSNQPAAVGTVLVESQKLVYADRKLSFEKAVRTITMPTELLGKRLKTGDLVSFHWGFVCDKLTASQAKILERYTHYHLTLANTTL
jgi:hypothetical protein